jgi:hypothetical protein
VSWWPFFPVHPGWEKVQPFVVQGSKAGAELKNNCNFNHDNPVINENDLVGSPVRMGQHNFLGLKFLKLSSLLSSRQIGNLSQLPH